LIKNWGFTLTEKTEPKSKQPTVDTNVADKGVADKDKPIKRSRSLAGLFNALRVMLVAAFLVATTSAGWLFWKDWQVKTQTIEKNHLIIGSLGATVSAAQDQSQMAIKQQRQQRKTIERLENQLQNLQLRVNAQGKRLVELGSTTRSDWLLAEAEYLARLAKQRLQTERSVKSPLALLESVDVILTQIDDPNLLETRSAVAADITSLRLTADVDREGIYLELQALASSVETLSLVELVEPPVTVQTPAEISIPEKQTLLAEFLADLASLIRVRQRQNPIEPILLPEEERIVRRNLQMMLEQAQVAVLREEQKIYRQTLGKAQTYLQRFFQSNPSNQAIYQRLAVLLETSIVQQLPDIYRSLEAIQTLLVRREQRLLEAEKPERVEPVQ